MSIRQRSSCHGQFDSSIARKENGRRSSLPYEVGNAKFLPPNLEEPTVCGNGPPRHGFRENACRSRRPFFQVAHLRPTVCSMAHSAPSCTRNNGHKRSLNYTDFGFEMANKKHKPCVLNRKSASAKSKHSKEMVSHKYRTVDSIQRSGVSNVSVEKQKAVEFSETKSRSSRVNKDGVPATPDMESIRSPREGRSCSYEGSPEDWTQEHLHEPRKFEKRKSLDELKTTDVGWVMSWSKKAKRRPRTGEKTVNTVLESPDSVEHFACPEEEVRKLLGSSEKLKLDAASDSDCNEQACSKHVSECQREYNSTGNGAKHMKDTVEVSQVVIGKSWLEDVSSGLSRPAVEGSHSAGWSNSLQPLDLNRVYVSNNDGDVLCSPQDDLDLMTPSFGQESLKDFVSKSKEGESLPILNGKDSVETLAISKQENEFVSKSKEGESLPTLNGTDSVETPVISKQEEVGVLINDAEVGLNPAEGRRCGLCGGDSRGEPPKYLVPVSTKTRKGQSTASDRNSSGYSEWDAFSNEPGWLGPLLGPLDDRFGIAGVWVHQECAIWSPEVYFAGVGHIKNIRAALRRGKLLKCSRCTRAGATIGCRIERCPRTYHLPCARFEGCFFDHKKFLMACEEHLHHFLPRLPGQRQRRNSLNLGRIRFKRKVGEWKKSAQRAAQLDAEAEDRWQENAGVDEEYLRRERKRFQRDIARIAPVMIGGGGEQHIPEGWESIAGSDNVVRCMKEMVILPLLYPAAFTRLGVSPPRGVLLHGHPGTGKTLAVKALVGACARGQTRIAYFARKGADCLGKYAGDAERQLRMLFYLAEKHQPSIIFFDEIDGLAPTRSQHQDQTQKSVVSTLLALMDGIKSRGSVVVIGATNRPDALDPALRRPGRFDREIYFPLPSYNDRASILTLLTKNWQLSKKDDIIPLLASRTVGFAGADLQALCAQAAINSLTRTVSLGDLMTLVEQQGISKTPPFPDLCVNATDWASALEQVSPPCTWRSAKAAVNAVVCAPVPYHIVPILLWPMVELLISLYLDDRVLLPPILDKLARLLEEKLKSNLGGSWIEQIDLFLHDTASNSSRKRLEQDLENVFTEAGMVSHQEVRLVMQNVTFTGSKFHVMVSGKERSWLDHLSAWFLFGFEGFVEMCNLNLTTMLQEGGGDVVQGLIHILGNIQNKSPCVVYMPQMESWALEPVTNNSVEELVGEQRQASHYWNIFVQQVTLLSASLKVVFLASCRMHKDEVPDEIVEFFVGTQISSCLGSRGSSCESSLQETWLSSNRSSPGLWVEESSVPDMTSIFRRASQDFAELLCQRVLHHAKSGNTICTTEALKPGQQVMLTGKEGGQTKKSLSSHPGENGHGHGSAEIPVTSANNETVLQQCTPVNNTEIRNALIPRIQPSALRPPEQTPLSVPISLIGYQLLYHPGLRELRHATSKLQEGPSFTTRVHVQKTSVVSTDSSNSQSDDVNPSEIKGLSAVGLLAYSGTYVNAGEVALGVQKVLELLMRRIDVKVTLGKDRGQYSHLFHQAASLEDKIFLWAYNLCRYDVVSNKMWGSTRENLSSKSKAGHESNALNLTQDPPSPRSLHAIESFAGSEVKLPASLANNVNKSVSCEVREMQSNVSNSQGFDNQPRNINTKVSNVIELHTGLASRKCCPHCLRQAKQALRKLFRKSWRSRGSNVSLDLAEEVIGSCYSTVSVAVNRVLSSEIQDHSHGAIVSNNIDCLCRADRRQRKNGAFTSSNDASSSREPLIPAESVDYLCFCPLIKLLIDLK